MDAERFLTIVAGAAGVGREEAERATRATLQTLGERIAVGEARDLAEQLPPELAPLVATTTPAAAFDVDDFVARIAAREGTDPATSACHAEAVLTALGQSVDPDEIDDLAAELSKDYWPLLPRGPEVEIMPASTFWQRVGERAGVDEPAAMRATDAVVQTLAERISAGEVDDLISRLPIALHAPLKRGRRRDEDAARSMPLDDFVRRVAEREDVSPADASRHLRAVLLTLREAVGDDEFFDVTDQLPSDYLAALR